MLLLIVLFIILVNCENCECFLHNKVYLCGTLLHSWEGIHILCSRSNWYFYHKENRNISDGCIYITNSGYGGLLSYKNGDKLSDDLSVDGCYYENIYLLCKPDDLRCYSNVTSNNKECIPIVTTDKTDNYWKYFTIICENDNWIVDPDNFFDESSKKETPKKEKTDVDISLFFINPLLYFLSA